MEKTEFSSPWLWWSASTLLAAVFIGALTTFTAGIIGGAFIGALLIIQGLVKIPTDPPHIGVLTFAGERVNIVKKEGWNFLFLYPYLFNVILINVEKVNSDFPPQKVRTPDNAESLVPVSVTWTPDTSDQPTENGNIPAINFLNYGGHDGVADVLRDVVQERIREWARASDEGPKTWEALQEAEEEATNLLLKAIIGESIQKIPSTVPTSILFKFFSIPKKIPDAEEAKIWNSNHVPDKTNPKNNWNMVEKAIGNDEEIYSRETWNREFPNDWGLVENYQEFLERKIQERRKNVKKARRGNGDYKIPQMGIILNRLNIKEIEVLGEIAKAAEKEVKEERERAAEKVELKHIQEQVALLSSTLNLTNEQALDLIQTERGKIVKKIDETRVSVSPETRAMVVQVAGQIAESISRKPGLLEKMAEAMLKKEE